MNRFKNSALFFWTIEILIAVGIVYLCSKVGFIFSPIVIFVSTIFVPLLLAGFLYYMLNPIVNLLMKIKITKTKKINRTWATAIVFLIVIGVIVYMVFSFVPRLITQVANMVGAAPEFAKQGQELLTKVTRYGFLKKVDWRPIVDKLQSSYSSYLKTVLANLTSSVGSIISMATNVVVTAITVPVILFYMLKDGNKLLPSIEKLMPALSKHHQKQTVTLLKKMNHTLSRYIGGQVIECLFVGTFTSLGYVLIGQKYALLLGVFAGLCNIIPYVGPYIGIIPSLFVAFSDNIMQVIWVIVVVIIVQQIDGNLVYPNVIGKSLKIHPLTIIIILLAAGHIAGLFGMILAIPVYAIAKVIIEYCYNIWLVQHDNSNTTPKDDAPS
ncbi:AI-2E family transporter [Fructilactobacillus fructivorans]|uniref:UPF0118 membrane protein YrrI n=1 Tax=Fructilactobacillus fructivorans TaxID=1614 RepID=A0A0C1Q0B8_9LACO|nr:AI-2E family transporter [Fructilactobacillus fructivorans]KID41338.1 UPF0118 membrane protein YrrI [Fructilactobacillus fructivorans]MCT0151776.1 AI-2E family transporter [Fructilactobacillus fructivorans]MCT2867096.1 AI-2E family transporter [Fructilactobacillus fructivorans]MCT2868344.1 AI-2E family transporter [Fructilactobacillus fructivorans]MCT2873052.1 AI-2E family transporter [Fructilactobacillus fructivorans]